MRTLFAQSHASTSHVTNLSFGTSSARTVWCLDTHLAVESVEHADKSMIGRHGFCDLVPVGCIERRVLWPADRVRVPSGILKVPDWSRLIGVDGTKGADVGVISVGIVDREVTCIDLVHAVSAVEVGQRCDARPNPANIQGMSCILNSAIVGIVDHELIFMGMPKEDAGNDMRRIAVDDLVEEILSCWSVAWVPKLELLTCGVGNRIRSIPAGQNVSNDPDSLAFVLCILELIGKEFQIAAYIGVRGVAI